MCNETSLAPRSNRFPRKVNRSLGFTKRSEIPRFAAWNWRKNIRLNHTHMHTCAHILIVVTVKKNVWVQGTKLPSSQLSWRTVDGDPVFSHLLLFSFRTLTTFCVIKETHFSCLGFPIFTSMFKVKVTNVVFYTCNRKRIKLIYCFGSHRTLYEEKLILRCSYETQWNFHCIMTYFIITHKLRSSGFLTLILVLLLF